MNVKFGQIIEKVEYNPLTRKKGYYRFLCKKEECLNEIKISSDQHALNTASGMCKSCSKHRAPFLSHWKNLFHDFRGTVVTISYEEFLKFTQIKNCHYCDTNIPWQPHTRLNKKSTAYYLDRKDNNGPYSVQNCVVCCTRCNRMKSNKFSYDEFLKFAPALKEIERLRND